MGSCSRIPFAFWGSALLGACGMSDGESGDETRRQVEEALRQAEQLEVAARPPPQRFTAYITGYSYWDNTPPGSDAIARPVVHTAAGGQGTYDDPITLAVGFSMVDGTAQMDVPAGTLFYIERLQKYAVVEDFCGSDTDPQNGPCHVGHAGYPWYDIYVGGRSLTAESAGACAEKITAVQTVIMNPAPNLPVTPGEVTVSHCTPNGKPRRRYANQPPMVSKSRSRR